MQFPFILTNFKNYESATLNNAEILAEIHTQAQTLLPEVSFGVAVCALDIASVAQKFGKKILVFAQHADFSEMGASTGKIVPSLLAKMGVSGVILNHSENRFLDFENLKKTVEMCKKENLLVVVCAETAEEGEKISTETNADFVAVEPPDLIGGDISVSTARPEIILESVEKIGEKKVLVGAGVKNGKDVQIALEKGAVGVLLASGVTKSANPLEVLLDLGR